VCYSEYHGRIEEKGKKRKIERWKVRRKAASKEKGRK
jgi:hypothetical protein